MELVNTVATLLHHAGRNPADVIWMGTQGPSGFRQTWAEFVEHAPTGVDYGEMDEHMVIVGDDWWIEWADEDVGWMCRRHPLMPDTPRPWTVDLRGRIVDVPEK